MLSVFEEFIPVEAVANEASQRGKLFTDQHNWCSEPNCDVSGRVGSIAALCRMVLSQLLISPLCS